VTAARIGRIAATLAVATLGSVGPARAQIAASLALQSDYRVRGVSMSDRQPALSLSVADDLANGVYAGGSAIVEKTSQGGLESLGHIEYLGFAARNGGGLGWDVGADNQDLTIRTAQPFRLRYSEAYFGVSTEDLSARISYSPNYLRPGLSIAYLEVNGAIHPSDDWRLSAHVGVFRPLAGSEGTTIRRTRYDARFDVVRIYRSVELDLAWVAATPSALPEPRRSHGALVAGATVSF
jgi:hypothetical protein